MYYQDRHYEIYNLTVLQFLKKLNNGSKLTKVFKKQYHSPICIDNTLFSPTKNIKDSDCEYFNLLKVEERDPFYERILGEKDFLTKAKLRFLDYKKKQLFD